MIEDRTCRGLITRVSSGVMLGSTVSYLLKQNVTFTEDIYSYVAAVISIFYHQLAHEWCMPEAIDQESMAVVTTEKGN